MNRRDFLKFLGRATGAALVAATVGLPEVEIEESETKKLIGKNAQITFGDIELGKSESVEFLFE